MSRLILKTSLLDTPLGPMTAISDDKSLYLLEFSDLCDLEKEIERLCFKEKAVIISGQSDPISMIKKELDLYFSGELISFKVPLHLIGSDFQKKVWDSLVQIPYGQTRSYKAQAESVGNEKAFRALANANGANQLAIVIPCHRIINHNGELGGYRGGKVRKEWLINHEKKYS
jgi:AraC family transcriptional regulator, regulatory protein of adaptative response / methylated-DNA-[protein]-cysteine methyltransferase